MPKTAGKRLSQAIFAVLGFILLSSCAPIIVPGLFIEVDGSLLPVLSKKVDNPTGLQADSHPAMRFVFSKPVRRVASSDLGIRMSVKGSITVAVFAREIDEVPFLTASFEGLGEPQLEFRLPLPEGSTVASMELSLEDAQSATIEGFSLSTPYIGYRAGGSDGSPALVSLGVQRFFASDADSWPREIHLPAAGGPGWSVVVRQGSAGTLQVWGKSAGFESSPHPDRPLAIPLELTGGLSVSVATLGTGAETGGPGNSSGSAGGQNNAGGIAEAYLHFGGDAPLSDLHAILAGAELAGSKLAGDFKLYRWDLLPDTLVFDFTDFAVQDRYFKRLAFFAEKPGFRGRLADDSEIAGLHGWNAHDYPPWTLASFYNLAVYTEFKLNASELALLELLLTHGILEKEDGGQLRPGSGAIISITRESTAVYRRIFMDHESSHALFFQDEAYRLLSERLWNDHDPATRQFWIRHLRWRNYDITDSYLSVNELQAYLVQQSLADAVSYIRDNVLARLAAAYPAKADG
ncbi:MAG: hypothetical protein ABIJ86_05395, partial [Spirochaetota bacterium]